MSAIQKKTKAQPQGGGRYVLELKTVHSHIFRVLFEALKEILTDVNIIFNDSGMKIFAMDSSHCVMVHLKLDADKFRQTGGHFYCEKELSIGVNLNCLWKLIKTVGNGGDVISWYIEKDKQDTLHIRIDNAEKGSQTNFKLRLLDLDEDEIELQRDIDFDNEITMPSQDFQKLCRDMSNLADELEIKMCGQRLEFSCKGDFAEQDTIIGPSTDEGGVDFSKYSNGKIIQGTFSLKYLLQFTKATNLCNSIKILIENDLPLVMEYSVASLGSLKFLLAPKNKKE